MHFALTFSVLFPVVASSLLFDKDDPQDSNKSLQTETSEVAALREQIRQLQEELQLARGANITGEAPRIANEYEIEIKVGAVDTIQEMDELVEAVVLAKTGYTLDVLLDEFGNPITTFEDSLGNVLVEESDSVNLNFPLTFSMVFQKEPSRQLAKPKDLFDGHWEEYMKLAIDVYDSRKSTIVDGSDHAIVDRCNFAFSGADDVQDWTNNILGLFYTERVGRYRVHGGFYKEFNKLRTAKRNALDRKVGACKNPSFIGHSMGGAIATIAQIYYGKGNVYTFGAPRVFWVGWWTSINCPDAPIQNMGRVFHTNDVVPSPFYMFLSHYSHGQEGQAIGTRCKRRSWGWCRKWEYAKSFATCDQSSKGLSFTWDRIKVHKLDYLSRFFFG